MPLLAVISRLFQLGVMARNRAFDFHLLPATASPLPTVSIGNVVAGGTGKTPLTLLLASSLAAQFRLAILLRGYRSPAEKQSVPMVVARGNGPLVPASTCGDEAFLLSKNIPDAWVIAGKNRRLGAKMALDEGAEMLLLDDGMQHRWLKRDVEIVMLDAKDLFGRGFFLPRGYLRDELKSLERADWIVVNHAKGCDFEKLTAQIREYNQRAPLIWVEPVASALPRKKVGIFCGIAKPKRFLDLIESLGATVVATLELADHRAISKEFLEKFSQECQKKGAEWLLCTEKDWVKLGPVGGVLPIHCVPISLAFVKGEENWQALLEQIRGKMKE